MAEPLIWVLLGRKAGDNTQVLALADALDQPYQRKQIYAHSWELLPHLLLGPNLLGIDRHESSELNAPWPDLVISAGRRNEPVARWIRQQSGGRTRLVHMGRPWADPSQWDLLVTTPQYFLPRADNIQHNQLPLYRLPQAELDSAAAGLLPHLEGLPRPWLTLLVGGDSGRFVLTPEKAARLGAQANQMAVSRGGSLLVSNSARTPAESFAALRDQLTAPLYCHKYGEGVAANPYLGFLAVADEFIITGESMSMLAEAAGLGKPLHIFDMDDSGPWWHHAHQFRFKPVSHRLAMALGPRRMRRDVGRIQEALVQSGCARWLGQAPAAAEFVSADPGADLAATVERVKQLL